MTRGRDLQRESWPLSLCRVSSAVPLETGGAAGIRSDN